MSKLFPFGVNAASSAAEATSFDVVIESAGNGNHYRFDYGRQSIVLDEVVEQHKAAQIERGHIQKTLADGELVRALVLTRFPTFIGCVVPSRPLGLVVLPDGEQWALLVPVADGFFESVATLSELPQEWRGRIERSLGLDQEHTGAKQIGWLEANAATDHIRSAQRAFRLAEAKRERSNRQTLLWLASELPAFFNSGEQARAHSDAEYRLRTLPLRFQHYIEEFLLPEERILEWLWRPGLDRSRFSGFDWWPFKRQHLNEGILVLTDRQLFFMADALPPGSTLVHWGYVAKTGALERLSQAMIEEQKGIAILHAYFEARGGGECVSIEFPGVALAALQKIEKVLQGFGPGSGTRSLQRLYDLTEEGQPATQFSGSDAEQPVGAVDGVPMSLAEMNGIRAWVRAPSWRTPPSPPRLLAVAAGDLIEVVEKNAGPSHETKIPIAAISSLELCSALTHSWIEWTVPQGNAVERSRVYFHYPAFPEFQRFFRILRQLLHPTRATLQ